jgi:hypothetical protein
MCVGRRMMVLSHLTMVVDFAWEIINFMEEFGVGCEGQTQTSTGHTYFSGF